MTHLEKTLKEYGLKLEDVEAKKMLANQMLKIPIHQRKSPAKEQVMELMMDLFFDKGVLKLDKLEIFSNKTQTESVMEKMPEWTKKYFSIPVNALSKIVFLRELNAKLKMELHIGVNSENHDAIYEKIENHDAFFEGIQAEYDIRQTFDKEEARQKAFNFFLSWMEDFKKEFDTVFPKEKLAFDLYNAIGQDMEEWEQKDLEKDKYNYSPKNLVG